MDITIRKATRQDCPAMMELIQELAIYERAPDEVTVSLSHFEESGFGANPVWWAFVAEHKEAGIVGMALWYIRYSTWKGQRMYLEDIVVQESYRGHGIGALLFNALQMEAKAKGFTAICWQVLDWNEPALHFYKKYSTHFDGDWINCVLTV